MPRIYKSSKIEVNCPSCGSVNFRTPWKIKHRGSVFCNRECYLNRPIDRLARFESRIMKSNIGCWEWIGMKNRQGYGKETDAKGILRLAHRLSWQFYVGEIPEGKFLLHRCDNPGCVRPDHLFLGTQVDNMKDMAMKSRQARGTKKKNAKLTDATALEIFLSKERTVDLSRKHGVTQTIISAIRHRRRWKHVSAAN